MGEGARLCFPVLAAERLGGCSHPPFWLESRTRARQSKLFVDLLFWTDEVNNITLCTSEARQFIISRGVKTCVRLEKRHQPIKQVVDRGDAPGETGSKRCDT